MAKAKKSAKKSTKPKGELSPKAKDQMDKVLARFESGDIGPVIRAAKIKLPDSVPASRWSIKNKALILAQLDTLYVRTYKQWQDVGRQVSGGSSGGFAWKMIPITEKNEETGENEIVKRRFGTFSVFAFDDTTGEPIPGENMEEIAPPPLLDVAERCGIKVSYIPGHDQGPNGSYSPYADKIALHVGAAGTFFHELAHAIQERVFGLGDYANDRKTYAENEVVAELCAATLSNLYGFEDRLGYSWEYITGWATEADATAKPMDVVKKVIEVAGAVLEFIFEMDAGTDEELQAA